MALLTLICPHCGGSFELDKDRTLQPFLTCPYCGNRSLMQKYDDDIRLRGILPGKGQTANPVAPPDADAIHSSAPAPAAQQTETTPVFTRPLEEMIAEAQSDALNLQAPEAAAVIPTNHPDQVRPVTISEEHLKTADGPEIDRLCGLAEAAAEKHDLPLFNSFSRQAIDCQPKDPRMYALRAILTEEADGFARVTWTNPTWSLLTPRRRQSQLAQHFYNLNTALKYCRSERQQELVKQIAWQMVRQAIDYFTEQAELRCRQKLFFKTFKGRFHRVDLRSATRFAETLNRIDPQVIPLCREDFMEAVRSEIRQAPPRIAKKLRRV